MPLGDLEAGRLLEEGARPARAECVAFVADAATEAALSQGLAEMQSALEIHRGGIRAATAAMQKSGTPRVLIVDVGGEDAPLAALEALAEVVEPHVCVLVVGDLAGLDFYREVTRSIGVAEYLAKPLSREVIARHFVPLARGMVRSGTGALGGRMITVTGARGGVGATTIAVSLAWHFGVTARRHTVLLDPDTHMGTAAFLMNAEPGRGLAQALQAPDRIDMLLAERAAHPVDERLHVLSGQDKLDTMPEHAEEAAGKLLAALRRRYNFIVADVPCRPLPLYRDLLTLSQRQVFVLDPSLAAVRDTLRLLELPRPESESLRPVLVLNRLGRPGGLTRRQVEDALQCRVDVAIPDLPKLVGNAATFGTAAVAKGGPFRDAVAELSRQVAFSRLLDTEGILPAGFAPKRGLFGRLRGRKPRP